MLVNSLRTRLQTVIQMACWQAASRLVFAPAGRVAGRCRRRSVPMLSSRRAVPIQSSRTGGGQERQKEKALAGGYGAARFAALTRRGATKRRRVIAERW